MHERRLLAQNQVLERIATGAPLGEVLADIVRMVEERLPGALCSLLLLSPDRQHLRLGAAPSLPDAYNRAIDGISIGPDIGSCGAAAWSGEEVMSRDLATDPRWRDYRHLAAEHGLASCWSLPILGSRGAPPRARVIGTFALYRRDAGDPSEGASAAVSGATHLAMLAIEREASFEALRESEARFRAILDNTTDALFLHGPDGIVIEANQQAERSLGYPREELIGKTASFFDPDFNPLALCRTLQRFAPGEVATFETRHRRADGTVFPVEIRLRSFQLLGRSVGMTMARDLTERRRMESHVREAQKLEAIGLLAGGVAHDFNNLLTVINTGCELLLDDLPQDSPFREELASIRDAGERAARLTGQLLAFSRRALVEPRVLDLNERISSIRAMLASLVGENIHLRISLDPSLPRVRIDPSQLEQVLLNLAVNARDAMPRGGSFTIATSVIDAAPPDMDSGRHVCLRLTDTGSGMSDEVKARAFEPFFTTKELGHGTGLGLATVFGIVKQAGGHIEIETALGLGTSFVILLPIVAEAADSPGGARGTAPRGSETVLLVEDDASVRLLAARVLERYGYRTIATASAEEALAAADAATGPIDLLLTDVIMPGLGGRELSDVLRTRSPSLRVLFMSGYTDDAVLRQGIENAGDSFLQKPFLPDALARKVRAVLDGSG